MTNKSFPGFPTRAEITPLPNLLFTTVIPQIKDIAELKTTLHTLWLLYHKRGYPRFVTYSELLSDSTLIRGISEETNPPGEILYHALRLATEHGTILHLTLDRDGESEDAYFINTETDRKAISKIQSGELPLPGLAVKKQPQLEITPPDIFSLYEQNIGMLTPIIAEELQEAEKAYPADWIESAFKEAVSLNKRNWRYIARILERWATEGRSDGKPERHSETRSDPSKYTKGKYGHLVKH